MASSAKAIASYAYPSARSASALSSLESLVIPGTRLALNNVYDEVR